MFVLSRLQSWSLHAFNLSDVYRINPILLTQQLHCLNIHLIWSASTTIRPENVTNVYRFCVLNNYNTIEIDCLKRGKSWFSTQHARLLGEEPPKKTNNYFIEIVIVIVAQRRQANWQKKEEENSNNKSAHKQIAIVFVECVWWFVWRKSMSSESAPKC